MTVVDKDHAYFLHQTPYRDNSALAHLFTQAHGKVSFVVGGLKNKKQGRRAFLQPCRLLTVGYQLKAQLSKLEYIDFADEAAIQLTPDISHFMLYQYANELLLAILPSQLPTVGLFNDYSYFLQLLSQSQPHAALRYIELALIILFIGLPDVTYTQDTQLPVNTKNCYYFYAESGLFTVQQNADNGVYLDGTQVCAFQHVATAYINDDFTAVSEALAQGAKPITAVLVQHLLGNKSLKTREIYRALQIYS